MNKINANFWKKVLEEGYKRKMLLVIPRHPDISLCVFFFSAHFLFNCDTYIIVNNMMMAAETVVIAAAKMEGPIRINADLVRSCREASPLMCE